MAIRFKQKFIITNQSLTGLSPLAGRSLEEVLNGYKNVGEIISSLTDYFCRVSTTEEVSPKGIGRVAQMISFPDGQAICQVSRAPGDYPHFAQEVVVHRNGENFFYKYLFNCELKES